MKVKGIIEPRNKGNDVWIRNAYKIVGLQDYTFSITIDLDLLDEHNIEYEITETHDCIIFESLKNVEDFADKFEKIWVE